MTAGMLLTEDLTDGNRRVNRQGACITFCDASTSLSPSFCGTGNVASLTQIGAYTPLADLYLLNISTDVARTYLVFASRRLGRHHCVT